MPNNRYLVDTGWHAAIRMPCYGIDPLGLGCLLFTHCHHDHYIGLPHLLFYFVDYMAAAFKHGRVRERTRR